MSFWLSETIIVAIVGVALTIITTFVGLEQYRLQGKQKRAESFFNMRRKLKENPTFQNFFAGLGG
jgi:predicted permease